MVYFSKVREPWDLTRIKTNVFFKILSVWVQIDLRSAQ